MGMFKHLLPGIERGVLGNLIGIGSFFGAVPTDRHIVNVNNSAGSALFVTGSSNNLVVGYQIAITTTGKFSSYTGLYTILTTPSGTTFTAGTSGTPISYAGDDVGTYVITAAVSPHPTTLTGSGTFNWTVGSTSRSVLVIGAGDVGGGGPGNGGGGGGSAAMAFGSSEVDYTYSVDAANGESSSVFYIASGSSSDGAEASSAIDDSPGTFLHGDSGFTGGEGGTAGAAGGAGGGGAAGSTGNGANGSNGGAVNGGAGGAAGSGGTSSGAGGAGGNTGADGTAGNNFGGGGGGGGLTKSGAAGKAGTIVCTETY